MTARVLDGAALGRIIRQEVAEEVAALKVKGIAPGLAVVLVGENPASEVYVRNKGKACIEAGMYSVTRKLPATVSQAELLATIDQLNADPLIHGILVQLPLPPHLNGELVLRRVNPGKDVDGFHPVNVGKLVLGDTTGFRPATPAGVIQLLVRSKIETKGAHAVVVGRSAIVGKPMANLLIQDAPGGNATVTVCHSRSHDLPSITRSADILIVAIGRPEFVTGEMVRGGAVVIDVGINRVDDPVNPKGYRIAGDVKYREVAEVAGAITPVPGGVGPMTIAMLLRNTLQAVKQDLVI
ncbi:MAG TPA: bifunctional methylenetetrahydrofolate dehydrogenase/methenyltetrahydrofolate cyclohydrolase FolD [Gemmatimonadales bacterium]|jgi:methylenetetrahydrofolate dehydrogenase (NADP+)/methenyltetrahydrofolate cyclohydrolase|nr:bifunctional methylenetetrahydrofolate dehydrogenase/methenyltetrahydrofolate cyclohydrolase FolD [Gemmatimonadales bacterium]